MHPSGLNLVRWHFPFKTPVERAMIQRWLQSKDINNSGTPF